MVNGEFTSAEAMETEGFGDMDDFVHPVFCFGEGGRDLDWGFQKVVWVDDYKDGVSKGS